MVTDAARTGVGTVVVTVPFGPDDLATLRRAFGTATVVQLGSDDPGLADALATADVAVLGDTIDDRVLRSPTLRWVHCDISGLDKAAHPAVFDRGLVVTGSAGRSAPALAQHAFYLALALAFDGPGLWEQQKRHEWDGIAGYSERRALWGQTLGIVGLGHTGREMAVLGRAFGMRVLAHRRTVTPAPPDVDRLYCSERGETIDEMVGESDVLMLACPLTDETHHLIDAARLSAMKPTAYLINLARGAVVDEQALVEALVEGRIAGAGLDVFETEPLPADAAVWSAPRVLITPHVTPRLPDRTQRSVRIIAENVRRFLAGEPMLNQLRPQDRYAGAAHRPMSPAAAAPASASSDHVTPEASS